MARPATATAPRSAAIWTAAFFEAFLLLVVAVLATAVIWSLRPNRLPWSATADVYELELSVPLLTVDQALELYDIGDHLFIDTRTDRDRRQEIPGSFRVRADRFDDDLRRLLDDLFPEDPLILYGDGDLVVIANVAERLQERGYVDVQVLGAGLQAWQNRGGDLSPVEATGDGEGGP